MNSIRANAIVRSIQAELGLKDEKSIQVMCRRLMDNVFHYPSPLPYLPDILKDVRLKGIHVGLPELPEWAFMSTLEELDVSRGSIDHLPDKFHLTPNLKGLSVGQTAIAELPESLKATKLTTFEASWSTISDLSVLPPTVRNIEVNLLGTSVPDVLPDLPDLYSLSLGGCDISDRIKNYSTIRQFSLYDAVGHDISDELYKLPHLEDLAVIASGLTEFPSIANTQIEYIDLSVNGIREVAICQVNHFKCIREIRLQGNPFGLGNILRGMNKMAREAFIIGEDD